MIRLKQILAHDWCPLALFFREAPKEPTPQELVEQDIRAVERELDAHHLKGLVLVGKLRTLREQHAFLGQEHHYG